MFEMPAKIFRLVASVRGFYEIRKQHAENRFVEFRTVCLQFSSKKGIPNVIEIRMEQFPSDFPRHMGTEIRRRINGRNGDLAGKV